MPISRALPVLIRLVLADDHPLILRGIEKVLASEPDCQILAGCGNGEEALEAVHRHQPDILVLDSRMPGMDSLEVIRTLVRERSLTRVILHAESSEEGLIREALRLGVRGIVLKELPPPTLLLCVRRVHGGSSFLEWRSAGKVLDELLRKEQGVRDVAGVLTRREHEILLLLCRGMRNKEIAKDLSIRESTVKVHLRHVCEKLHLKGRLAVLRWAQEKGLF